MTKSCGNCVNVFKYKDEIGNDWWSCENCYEGVGMPVNCTPPYDKACKNWSNNPKDIDKACNDMRNFIDNYWANCDD